MKRLFLLFGLSSLILGGCYNDNYEELYPAGGCDTTNTTFSSTVNVIIETNCANSTSCHKGAAASGWDLSTYVGIKATVDNGKLLGTINWASGFSQMPKMMPKLSDCDIARITKWVKNGSQNN